MADSLSGAPLTKTHPKLSDEEELYLYLSARSPRFAAELYFAAFINDKILSTIRLEEFARGRRAVASQKEKRLDEFSESEFRIIAVFTLKSGTR